MKKLYVLTTLVVVFFSMGLRAQELDLGVKAGANFATLNDASGLDNKTGFQAGAFLGLKLNDHFAIQPELLYSQQGAKFDKDDFNLDYINVPIILKFYLIGGLNVQVGPQFGFVTNDNLEEYGEDIETNNFDFSGSIGAGYDLPLGLRVDARYNLGLTKIADGFEGKNGVFSIAVGYSFL